MARIGLIGGTGAPFLGLAGGTPAGSAQTAWGAASGPLKRLPQQGHELLFLARHGDAGEIPPHRVNYRANIQLFADAGVEWLVALNAVGAIDPALAPASLVLPEQLIDYTWGREQSYFDGAGDYNEFIDFTYPYDAYLRDDLEKAAATAGVSCHAGGIYGVTQGPRLETAAEIDRFERDGCSIVGMTAMPEAALARERGLRYAGVAVVVNPAAGRSAEVIHASIRNNIEQGMHNARSLLEAWLTAL